MMPPSSPKHRIYSLILLTNIERNEFLLSLISWRDGLGIPSSSSPISSPLSIAFWCPYPTNKRDKEEQEKAKEESYRSLQNRIEVHQFDSRLVISIHSFPEDVYPYNYLRNEAIKRTSTSHYYVSDMDMIPAGIFFFVPSIQLGNLYETLTTLPPSILADEWLAVIIPAYEYRNRIRHCNTFKGCVSLYIYSMIHFIS